MNVKHFPSKKVLNLILQAKEYCLVSVQDFSGGQNKETMKTGIQTANWQNCPRQFSPKH